MTLGPSPLGRSSPPPSSSSSMPAPSVIVHTVNVVRNIKPSQGGQVADAVHQTLHFALDGLEDDWAQPDDAAEEQRTPCGGGASSSSSSAPPSTTSASGIPVRRGFVANPVSSHSQDRPYISFEYSTPTHTLHLPHSAAIPDPLEIDPCGPQGREDHDVTAKMHLPVREEGDDDDEGALVEEALQQLKQNTGLLTVDTLILAFEGLSPEGSGDEALQRDVDRVRRVWQSLSPSPFIQSLGLADVPASFLEALFPRSSVKPSPPRVPSAYRLPRVIALRSSPPSDKEEAAKLTAWGQGWEETVGEPLPSILSHSDPPTILPRQALRSLLGEFATRLPFPQQSEGVVWAQRAEPKWCLRVTVINRDRGLVSGKSYLVKAGPPRSIREQQQES